MEMASGYHKRLHAATTASYHTKAQIRKPKVAAAAVSFGENKNGQTISKRIRVARWEEVG